ncbi:hypothetical protein DV532_29780 (plasmid) [Pseudomonas sp. Leaf58]|uniref:hypothetical protein n=1 Tax=Pseudomonas sp. Leaf58 TaxID=1736226 RepID=UPI0006F90E1E|nr:hypothetical protein [Pseudomonas sp. Leaf58]AYG48430.1 hypothetical protein DV532_29780 [Pseudomonas sp. Leaf58]KQN62025.1 hypothetical protein ASF02_07540 [Pseudomonas sp. Leaf58]
MFLPPKIATAVIDAFAKGDSALPLSIFTHLVDQCAEDERAVACIFDFLGFIPEHPEQPLVDFFQGLDDLLANTYCPIGGIDEALRTEASEHQAARVLEALACPRSRELAIWRINTKWRGTEHFAHLDTVLGWRPTPREFSHFAANAGRWKARASDFSAALAVYLQTEAMTACPFPHVDEVRLEPLVAALNDFEKRDLLTTGKLRMILEVYRRGARIQGMDNFTFMNLLVEKHGLDKRVALQLEELHEDFLIFDLGL